MIDENNYKNISTPVELLFCTDVLSIHDFKRHLKWQVIGYDLKDKINVPENFEIMACQAAAEGKKLDSVLQHRDSILSWSAKDALREEIKKHADVNAGLAKAWVFCKEKNFAAKVFDRYEKSKYDDDIVCISNIEELKAL